MESVGKILYEARTGKGLSLYEVEHATSIRRIYLEAIENDDYSSTPGEVFVKGIIRTYGNYLGLNGPELVDMYKAARAGIENVAEVKSAGIREVNNVNVGISLKQKENWGAGNASLGKVGGTKRSFPVKQFAAGLAAVLVLAGGYFALPKAMEMLNAPSSEPAQTEQAATANNAAAPAPAPVSDKVQVEMTAGDECWLEVTADGKEAFAGMLQKGDTRTFDANEKLIIKYGNIGAMQIKVNGQPVSVAGEHGVAVKTYTK